MAVAGKKLLVQFSTASGGTYTTIAEMNNASFAINGENIDVTAFGSSWRSRIRSIRDISVDVSGFYKSTDTAGQNAARNSLVDDTDLYVRVLLDGTTSNYILTQAFISNYTVNGSVDGAVETSISIEGSGAPTVTS